MDNAGIGFFMFAAGGLLSTIGFGMLGWGYQGKIAKYSARETKDAVTIAGDGAGVGLATGIRRGGGIKLDMGGGGSRSSSREVVKIRCRKCGYLDSEDAKYCSKCGSRI
ncbi:MAG: hypothetical protein ACMUIG_09640 [Thermoplasmatota archaeon]